MFLVGLMVVEVVMMVVGVFVVVMRLMVTVTNSNL